MAAEPDLKALERHATYRQGGPFKPAKQGEHMGSYGPLADQLHRSEPVAAPMPAPTSAPRTDQVMRTVKPRRETAFERAVEGSVRRGTLSRESADALLENRFPQWLDEQFAAKKQAAAAEGDHKKSPAASGPATPGTRV